MSEDLLDNFLSIAANELKKETTSKRELRDANLFIEENSNLENSGGCSGNVTENNKITSLIHNGDTDSSDDEDNKYEERKYNQFGRDIKYLLKSRSPTSDNIQQSAVTWKSKPDKNLVTQQRKTPIKTQNCGTDPIFGLRIVNPLISFTTLQEKMTGREAVTFARVKNFIVGNISDKNWVIAGVIAGKSAVKTSQKGNQFLIWSLSDLKDDIKTVSVFLFGSAYKQLWKTATGTVVGILNPSVLDKKDGLKDEATLSVDNAQKVMILGQSKDLGRCKSTKKNGEQCTGIVNVSRCDYCIYHIKQEYQKCSKRSELQSSFAGKGLTALRNKVLGKNEVFYAGKSYTAIPVKRSKKLETRDESLLQALSGNKIVSGGEAKSKRVQKKNNLKVAAHIEVTHHQRMRDLTLLERLGGTDVKTTFNAAHSSEATIDTSKKVVTEVLAKLKQNNANDSIALNSNEKKTDIKNKPATSKSDVGVMNIPLLSDGGKGIIDLNVKITSKLVNRAKLNAVKYIQRNGPLKKSDPNSVKNTNGNKKRVLEHIETEEGAAKRQKIQENEFLSDRFKKMMEATSKHTDLLDVRDNEEQEKYFHKLEVKEQMEEKMANTYKVPCKAVRCLKCKYTNFSASQFCKDEKHPLRVFDAVKRFFKCGNCGNRTQSLEIVPTTACKNCGSGKWERTGMMKEKIVEVAPTLSIRGGEQTFVNSVATDANLDLLVPDE